jgi:Tfp pilus assembly protein PilO
VIRNLSRRERIIGIIGLVALVTILGWEYGVGPALERSRTAARLGPARRDVLARRHDLLARKPAIARELEVTNQRLAELSGRFLPGATPAVAASELQKLVKDLAVTAKTEVRSERILPAVERGELLEVPIEVTVSGEIGDLVTLLRQLDATPRLLSIQDVRIRVVNVSQPRELFTTLTLSGFIAGKAKG